MANRSNGILKMNPGAGNILPTKFRRFWPSPWHRVVTRSGPQGTVIRAGYALMYNQMPLNIPLSMWQSALISPNDFHTYVGRRLPPSLPLALLALMDWYCLRPPITPNSPLPFQAVNSVHVAACSGLSNTEHSP